MKTFRELMEIVAPDVKTDIKSLDATSFAKKHGKTKTEIKNTFESAEEKVPEPGREAVGGRFTSRPPKSVIKPAPQVTSEEIKGIDEMDKSQTPPGRDGGEQFPPGPKVSKKTIKAVQKDPAKHLSDLFAKQYAKKKMKEEVEQIDENSDPKAEEAYKHYKKHVLPIHKKHGLSPEFAKAVNHHVAKYGSYQVWNHHGDAEGGDPHWFDSEKQKVKSIKQKRGYEVSEEVVEPPFAGPYKKPVGTVKDKSGAVHTPMSRAKDLAKKAAMRQAGMKKESIHESRRADIIREAMKAAKEKVKKEKSTADEDKFVADPELNSKVIKTASQM